jgi:putative ABC transport system ATP-binding protein
MHLQTQDVTKIYPHPTTPVVALQKLDFQVEKGEFCAIVGASGSGKSTLLNILGGLLKPTTGKVWVGEQEITQLTDTQLTLFRRQAMGFIFQDYNLLPVLTALENIAFGLRLQNLPAQQAHEKAYFWLEKVGLLGKEKVLPAQLSGGQQQRVAIARALAMQPQVIIADEPTSSLDSQNALQIAELLKNLQKNTQTTLILATHDSRLLPFADRIVEIQDGCLKID